jgi:hypothetical protein
MPYRSYILFQFVLGVNTRVPLRAITQKIGLVISGFGFKHRAMSWYFLKRFDLSIGASSK